VVIPEVTREGILSTLPELVSQQFFDHIRPVSIPVANGAAK
jgi:hypothetical protein